MSTFLKSVSLSMLSTRLLLALFSLHPFNLSLTRSLLCINPLTTHIYTSSLSPRRKAGPFPASFFVQSNPNRAPADLTKLPCECRPSLAPDSRAQLLIEMSVRKWCGVEVLSGAFLLPRRHRRRRSPNSGSAVEVPTYYSLMVAFVALLSWWTVAAAWLTTTKESPPLEPVIGML